jgi:Zn finger protein HypA/HybF involved in hydrogenase expression
VERARHKVARFLIEGKHLQIDGGEVHFERNLIRCDDCGHLLRTSIDVDTTHCPNCGSINLADLAGGYGHGRCCRRHRSNRRR